MRRLTPAKPSIPAPSIAAVDPVSGTGPPFDAPPRNPMKTILIALCASLLIPSCVTLGVSYRGVDFSIRLPEKAPEPPLPVEPSGKAPVNALMP